MDEKMDNSRSGRELNYSENNSYRYFNERYPDNIDAYEKRRGLNNNYDDNNKDYKYLKENLIDKNNK